MDAMKYVGMDVRGILAPERKKAALPAGEPRADGRMSGHPSHRISVSGGHHGERHAVGASSGKPPHSK